MAYQTISSTNDRLKCGITVSCVSNGTAVGDITSVVVKKKYLNGTWKVIKTVPITEISDFTFSFFDPDTRSGFTYQYASIPVTSTSFGKSRRLWKRTALRIASRHSAPTLPTSSSHPFSTTMSWLNTAWSTESESLKVL